MTYFKYCDNSPVPPRGLMNVLLPTMFVLILRSLQRHHAELEAHGYYLHVICRAMLCIRLACTRVSFSYVRTTECLLRYVQGKMALDLFGWCPFMWLQGVRGLEELEGQSTS